jgi:hypothetical protein
LGRNKYNRFTRIHISGRIGWVPLSCRGEWQRRRQDAVT